MKRSVFKQGCAPALPSASAVFAHSGLRSPTDLFAFERGGGEKTERKEKKSAGQDVGELLRPPRNAQHTQTRGPGWGQRSNGPELSLSL